MAKAREFLVAADVERDHELYNAAISSAVISGINSKDAICLALTRTSQKSANHVNAVGELEAAGARNKHASTTSRLAGLLESLLALKTRAQYAPYRFTHDDAEIAIGHAQELFDAAVVIVT